MVLGSFNDSCLNQFLLWWLQNGDTYSEIDDYFRFKSSKVFLFFFFFVFLNMRYHPGRSRSDYNLSRFDVVFILNYLYFSTWKCKYFEMQNPAILQVKILAGNFASPGGRPSKRVGCVWWVSAEYLPTKISFWVCSVVLLADGFFSFLFKRQENSVNKSGQIQEQHRLRSRGIDDGSR